MDFASDGRGGLYLPQSSPREQLIADGKSAFGDGLGLNNLAAGGIDPLARLLDPTFTETLWEYEGSKVEPMIPGNLHPKQQDALDAVQRGVRSVWLFWGNQVGKTSLCAILTILVALGRINPGNRWKAPITAWASALTWELWENIMLPELLTWIPPGRLLDAPEPHKHSTKRHITLRADNGRESRITGKAAEQGEAKYQSARLHWLWCDEEHPEAVYDETRPRLVRHGGISVFSMTPLKGLTWVNDRVYEPWTKGEIEDNEAFVSHAGLQDNPSIKPDDIERVREAFKHNPAMASARIEGKFVRPQGLVLTDFNPKTMVKHGDLSPARLEKLMARGEMFASIDFGLWRFAFTLFFAEKDGGVGLIDEIFSQKESRTNRAKKIHDCLTYWKAPHTISIQGDCANPQDIVELNEALAAIESPYSIGAVHNEFKIIKAGIERLNDLIGAGRFWVRRGIGEGSSWHMVWFHGMKSNAAGKPIRGSRWLWESGNWMYPQGQSGKAQNDLPNDHSADGADMMAASRYGIMTWWKPDKAKPKKKKTAEEEFEASLWSDDDEESTNADHAFGDSVQEGG